MSDTFSIAGRPVRRIGFGAMQLPGPRVFGPPRDRAAALAVLRRAVELGVNHIDTAQFYGPDVSNELIHAALHPYPDDLVLVSKVGAVRDEKGGWKPAQRPDELRAGVEDNLRSLERERIDVVNLRLLEEADTGVSLADQLAEMVALRDEGKIGGVGISNANFAHVREAVDHTTIACVQNMYNLRQRDDEPVLTMCRERSIPYVPFFPLGSAFPGSVHVTDDAAVKDVAARIGATPAQVGMAWLLAQGDNVLLIPGTSSVAHLEENLSAQDVRLDDEALAALG